MESDILQTLYSRHYRAALLYTLSLCRDSELAQDIVADAFVKAFIALPHETPSFRYWLLRVCKNLWIDHLRRQPMTTSDDQLSTLSTGRTPETRYLESERYRCLWNAIDSLPPVDREIVTLHYFSNLSLQEVAGLVGKSYAAVRQRLTRLRYILKQKMEEQGYGF